MADCIWQACGCESFTKRYKTHLGLKSKIWKYFGFLSDSDGIVKVTPDEAICELCNERIKRSNNTTNLLTHLKRPHSIEYDEIISEMRKLRKAIHLPQRKIRVVRRPSSKAYLR